MPFRSRSKFVRGPRRGVEWIGAALAGTALIAPGGVTSWYILLPSQVRGYTDPTLVRTRGLLYVISVGVGAHLWAAGIIPWKDANDTAPTGDSPNPLLGTDLDWSWHQFGFSERSAAQTRQEYMRLDIDSKAMRKLGADTGVLISIYNGAASSNDIRVWWGARCLLKE